MIYWLQILEYRYSLIFHTNWFNLSKMIMQYSILLIKYFWDSTATVQETNIYHCLDNFGCLWSIKCYMIWQCYSSLIGSVFSSCVLFLSQKESVSLNQHSFETCHHSDGCFWCFFHLLPGKALLVLDILAYEKKKKFYSTFISFSWFSTSKLVPIYYHQVPNSWAE